MTESDLNLVAITEQVADWRGADFEIRLEERVISHVLLSGGSSKNGHRYSELALRDAVGLYDRKPVFLDHAANLAKPYDRSMRDLAGWIVEARYVDGRIQGGIQVLDTEAGRTLLALMSAETPAVGMSHVILARKSTDGTVVEKIHDVISVDAVVFPATTTGFREQFDSPDNLSGEETRLSMELERQVQELREELDRTIAERDELRERCENYFAESLQRDIDRELAAAKLPDFAITESLRERLRSANTSETRSRLIAEHRQFVLRCQQRAPCSRARVASAETSEDVMTRQLVHAVIGRRSGACFF